MQVQKGTSPIILTTKLASENAKTERNTRRFQKSKGGA